MDLTRKAFLAQGAAAAGALALGPLAATSSAATRRRKPVPVTRQLLWDWHEMVADGGPRLTGNQAHSAYVEFLADQLERRRFTVQRDHLSFTKWEARNWSLVVEGDAIPLAYYYPYSGVTPKDGVTAPLVYCGSAAAPLYPLARGKIAVVEAPVVPLPYSVAFLEQGRYPADAPSPALLTSTPSVVDLIAHPDLVSAKAAGVLGVVVVRTGVSDGLAADQYSPFTTPYQDCPAVWALPSTGERLRTLALRGATATLTMDATLTKSAPSDTIYATLPGTDPREAVVVNTHTDGPNVPEENGGLGLLALADHFARIPRSRRRRSLIFVFATGHFQLPQFARGGVVLDQAASRWMQMHPELLDGRKRKTVAALTVEHLGCREWLDDPNHTAYGPTGLNEPGYCYTTTDAMKRIWLQSAAGTANTRTIAAKPSLYFGEGAPFYKAGIATMSLIPGQTYLCAAPKDGAISRLSQDLIAGQLQTFTRAIGALDQLSAAAIGTP